MIGATTTGLTVKAAALLVAVRAVALLTVTV